MLLNRPLRPWLQSISNWSFLHSQYPQHKDWEHSYRHFVAHCDPELQNTMPTTLNNLQNMVRFWIPVWLAYQTWLDIKSPKWITSDWSLINDGKSTIPISANQSQFSPIFKKQFDKLIAAMPDLKLSSNDNRLFQNELRRKLLERSASAT